MKIVSSTTGEAVYEDRTYIYDCPIDVITTIAGMPRPEETKVTHQAALAYIPSIGEKIVIKLDEILSTMAKNVQYGREKIID